MIKIGILGPVGSGKTTLIETLTVRLRQKNHRVGVVTNDVVSMFDANRIYQSLVQTGVISEDLLKGIVTGGCPHTAVREDPSANLRAIESLSAKQDLDIVLIESGGDNVMSTFSPLLADYTIFVLDTAAGDKYPRKGGLGITESDLLVVNKIDLAPYVGADLEENRRGALAVREGKPFVLVSLKMDSGIDQLMSTVEEDLGV